MGGWCSARSVASLQPCLCSGVPDILGGLGELDISSQAPLQPAQPQALFDDPFAPPQPQQAAPAQAQPLPVLLPAAKGKGLTILGRLKREAGQTGISISAIAPVP